MLHRLRGGQQAGVERGRVGILLHDLLAFVENALDRIALLAARRLAAHVKALLHAPDRPALLPGPRLAEHPKALLPPLDLSFGLLIVLFESSPQLVRLSGFSHL